MGGEPRGQQAVCRSEELVRPLVPTLSVEEEEMETEGFATLKKKHVSSGMGEVL